MTEVSLFPGTALLVETDGASVALQASRSSPPGSLLTFALAGVAATYRVKVRGCRKIAEDAHPFRIEGRFVDSTKEQREAILRAAAFPAP
jgi:hypothetical protein